jgi:hypothetical protein
MAKPDASTDVLTIRVPRSVVRRLTAEARRRRLTRSAMARAILEQGLGGEVVDPLAEARRQSLLVRRRKSERDVIRFITDAADLEGWK